MAKKEIKFLEAGKCCFCGTPTTNRFQPYDTEDVEADGRYLQAYRDINCPKCNANYTEWHRVEYTLDSIKFNDDDWTDVEELEIGTVVDCNEED